VSTTYWPLSQTLDFLARRNVEVIDSVPAHIDFDATVLVDLMTQPELMKGNTPSIRVGRYAILSGDSYEK